MLSTTSGAAYEETLSDLARVIRQERPNCLPRETARQLLAYDQPGHTALVGVNWDATRAVLYHERDRYVIDLAVGPDGLADTGPTLADFRTGGSIDRWVETMDSYWGWVHPRFR